MSDAKNLDPALAAVLDAAAVQAKAACDLDYGASQAVRLSALFGACETPAEVAELLLRAEKNLANNFSDAEALLWATRVLTIKLRDVTQSTVAVLHSLSGRWFARTTVSPRITAEIERARRLAIAMRMLADELDAYPSIDAVLLERPVRSLVEYFPHLRETDDDFDYDKTMCDMVNDLHFIAEVVNARRSEMYAPPMRRRAGRRGAK